MDLLLAEVDVATKAGKYVMYVLAVAGGFLIGNVLTLLVVRLVARFAFKDKPPFQLERALRMIGGIVVAVLVAWLLFRFGTGWGLGGSGSGEGNETGGLTDGTANMNQGKVDPKASPKPKDDETVIAGSITITIDQAARHPKTFRFPGVADSLDLKAAREQLGRLHEAAKGKEQLVIVRVYQNSTEAGHKDVRAFLDHANDLGMATKVIKVGERLD